MSANPPAPSAEELVHKYQDGLYRFARSLTKEESAAMDLVQDTFLTFLRKGDSVRDVSKIKSWLFTTLYRAFLRQHKRSHRQVEMETVTIEETHADEYVHPVRGIQAGEAVQALESLEARYREPLTLFFMEDLSYKEISAILDLPIGTVMSRLSRGKEVLKRALSENRPE